MSRRIEQCPEGLSIDLSLALNIRVLKVGCSRSPCVRASAEAISLRRTDSMKQQFDCHYAGYMIIAADDQAYDLEPERPADPDWGVPSHSLPRVFDDYGVAFGAVCAF